VGLSLILVKIYKEGNLLKDLQSLIEDVIMFYYNVVTVLGKSRGYVLDVDFLNRTYDFKL